MPFTVYTVMYGVEYGYSWCHGTLAPRYVLVSTLGTLGMYSTPAGGTEDDENKNKNKILFTYFVKECSPAAKAKMF